MSGEETGGSWHRCRIEPVGDLEYGRDRGIEEPLCLKNRLGETAPGEQAPASSHTWLKEP